MMMPILLDTSVLSEASKPKPHPDVMRFLGTADNLFIPAGTLIELQLGIMQVCARDPIKAVKLSAWYQDIVRCVPLIPTKKEVCEVLGTLAADPKLRSLMIEDQRAKKRSGLQDLHIAAAALVHRAAIATFNVADFLLIDQFYPLPGIYNPLTDVWHARMEPMFELEEPLGRPESSLGDYRYAG